MDDAKEVIQSPVIKVEEKQEVNRQSIGDSLANINGHPDARVNVLPQFEQTPGSQAMIGHALPNQTTPEEAVTNEPEPEDNNREWGWYDRIKGRGLAKGISFLKEKIKNAKSRGMVIKEVQPKVATTPPEGQSPISIQDHQKPVSDQRAA